jgi:phage/plasmid primase-like uncharacterized protein
MEEGKLGYMTFADQLKEHIEFLQHEGLDVEEIRFCENGVRCYAIGKESRDRGEYWYKSVINQMGNGRVGVVTLTRGSGGKKGMHKTYGQAPTGDESIRIDATAKPSQSNEKPRKAEEGAKIYFETQCLETGESEYLKRKKVKSYGIRFHISEKWGVSAVVPARDADGKIISCLHLNEDGSKRWLEGYEVAGAFHALSPLENAEIIGICEGYATASTCMEALEIASKPVSVVAAFACWNVAKVGRLIKQRYPNAKILFLADNDRHLSKNEGLEAAKIAQKECGATSTWLAPSFLNLEPSKALTDWNDLARECGAGEVRSQILRFLRDEGWL